MAVSRLCVLFCALLFGCSTSDGSTQPSDQSDSDSTSGGGDGDGGDEQGAGDSAAGDTDAHPTATDDAATVDQGVATLIDVLANDTAVNGVVLAIASVTQPAHGAVTIAADASSVSYAPIAGFCAQANIGPDNFTYALVQGEASATVAVTVKCACGQATPTTFVVEAQ